MIKFGLLLCLVLLLLALAAPLLTPAPALANVLTFDDGSKKTPEQGEEATAVRSRSMMGTVGSFLMLALIASRMMKMKRHAQQGQAQQGQAQQGQAQEGQDQGSRDQE